MSITRWEPFKDLMTLREAMDRLFEESYVRPGPRYQVDGTMRCALPINAYTTDEEIVITAAIPGVDPDKVEITFENETLTIRGEMQAPLENVEYILQERTHGKFERTLRLNIAVQPDKAEATFDQGVLTLVIPKREELKPRTIKITTSQ